MALASGKHLTLQKESNMFAKWSDDMVKEYFDSHWGVTLHQLSALSGRTKVDLKRVLMSD